MNEISMTLLIGLSLFASVLSLGTLMFCGLYESYKITREAEIEILMKGPEDYLTTKEQAAALADSIHKEHLYRPTKLYRKEKP